MGHLLLFGRGRHDVVHNHGNVEYEVTLMEGILQEYGLVWRWLTV